MPPGEMNMGDTKDEPKKLITKGATAGTLLYTVLTTGILLLVLLLIFKALM
jgi:uncharacterized integral membrane protein